MVTSIREFIRYMTYVSFRDFMRETTQFAFIYIVLVIPTILITTSMEAGAKSNWGAGLKDMGNHIPKSLIVISIFAVGIFLLRGRHINFKIPKFSVCLTSIIVFWFSFAFFVSYLVHNSVLTILFFDLWMLVPAYLAVLAENGKHKYENS